MMDFFKSKTNILLSIILVLAAFIRLYKIGDYMTFLGDEGRDVLIAYNILHGHLTLLGPRSSAADFYYGPIYYYLIAPFLFLFHYDPVGPAVFIGLVGIATVFLVYKVTREFFGVPAALVASILYTFAPLVVSYSRSSWNPNPLPFVSLLSLYLVYRAIKNPSSKLFLIVGFLLGIGLQMQYIFLYQFIIISLFILISYWRQKKLQIQTLFQTGVRILAGFLVGFSPFIGFELIHKFPNTKTIIHFILVGNENDAHISHLSFNEKLGDAFLRLFGRVAFNFPPADQISQFHLHVELFQAAIIVLGLFSIGILLYQLFTAKGEKFFQYLLITLWSCVGIFLFGFYRKEVFDYYFGFMFPVPFLLLGNMFQVSWQQKYIKFVALAVFLWLLYLNVKGIPFLSEPNRQKDQVKMISDFVLSKTDNKPFNFALLTLGNSDFAYRYFFHIEGHDPVTIENPQVDPGRKSVTQQLLVVCEDPNCQPEGAGLWEVAGFGRAKIVGKWDVSVVKVYKLEHYKGK